MPYLFHLTVTTLSCTHFHILFSTAEQYSCLIFGYMRMFVVAASLELEYLSLYFCVIFLLFVSLYKMMFALIWKALLITSQFTSACHIRIISILHLLAFVIA